ncbi:hypothetical protein HPB49_022433 [Dermacentor silvarum]|uniref:Uncharacterized protein n=1 Tax=Dermacentor silvarum TaxID=543639 RepID=A0ACB8CBU2_DERSI|nr:hypothetical protein HPB49_022433 [Dermacentor silvarum]
MNIKRMNTAPKKPHLRKEDIKIIIRPRDGFNTARYSVAQIGDCILRATGLKPEEVVKDSIRINQRQNIVVVNTPALERADKYSGIIELRMGDKTYVVTAYMTAPEDSSRLIIRGILDYDTPEGLVNERNPGILHAKRMGRTNLAIIVFQGTYVPRYVYYRSYEYQCRWTTDASIGIARVPAPAPALGLEPASKVTDPSGGLILNPEPAAGWPPELEPDRCKSREQNQGADTPDRYRRAGQTPSPAEARMSRLLPPTRKPKPTRS